MDLACAYRLAPYAALRPERFGGLIYRHDNRRLYFLHSPELVAFLGALEGSGPLGVELDTFVAANRLQIAARESLVRSLTRLEQLQVLDRLSER